MRDNKIKWMLFPEDVMVPVEPNDKAANTMRQNCLQKDETYNKCKGYS